MSDSKTTFLCPLPWKSLSMDSNGELRLCCHATQNSSLMLKDFKNPKNLEDALNHSYFQSVRDSFEKGQCPQECLGCFQAEQAGGTSPRQDYLKRFSNDSVSLEYLDLTLGNQCNLSCRMCSPAYSKALEKDFNELGIKFSQLKNIPSIEASCLKGLSMMTLTGGEPFLGQHFYDLASKVENKESVTLRLYTNLSVLPEKWLDLFCSFKKVELFVSLDGVDEVYEYIRYPGRFQDVKTHLDQLLQVVQKRDNLQVRTHTVLMAANLGNIKQMISFLDQYSPMLPSIGSFTLLERPFAMMALHLPPQWLGLKVDELKRFIDHLNPPSTFSEEWEGNRKQLHGILDRLLAHKDKGDPFSFFSDSKRWDVLRGQNLFDIYPDLKGFLK